MRLRVLALVLVLSSALWAADQTGSIAGNVSDPSGAAITAAKVTATNINTGLTRDTTTGTNGGYVFPLLPVGFYSITIEAQGFRRFEQRGIEVKTDQSSTVPVSLEIGSATQSVTVEANAEMVQTQSGALTQVVGQQKIVELPLNGRNAATLILLTPGTADTHVGNFSACSDTIQSTTYPGAQSVSANGARTDMVNYNMDGTSNQDPYTNVNNPFPNPDALEEFSVQTNSFTAEYGRGSGAIVNVVTKSGTNQFHGSAFEFIRNGALNARNFFAAEPDQLKRNQFGGSIGGPILRNKLFFFGSYQGTQLRNISQANNATVPSPAERSGDFSEIPRPLVNPFTGAPFANNQIPVSDFAPATVKLLSLIPEPTAPGNLVYYSNPDNEHENQFLTRIDYDQTRNRIFGRYLYSRYGRDAVVGSQNILTSNRGLDLWDQGAAIGDTFNFTPNLLNSFIFSYNQNNGTVVSGAPFSWTSLGIPVASTTPPEIQLSVSGYFAVSSGHPTEANRHDYHASDTVHWVHGAHEFAIGGDYLREHVELINTYRQNAQFTFASTNFSGDPLSDFFLGYVQKFIQGGGEFAERQANLGSLFFQDNYRVNRNLVLNLGLRWDPFVPGRRVCHRG